jgi:hypothetical protein
MQRRKESTGIGRKKERKKETKKKKEGRHEVVGKHIQIAIAKHTYVHDGQLSDAKIMSTHTHAHTRTSLSFR